MSEHGPNFDELVGTELGEAERERLLRVHELLVAAGPPPDWQGVVTAPPTPATVIVLPRRRRVALVALAAAFALAVFGAGYFVGNRGSTGSPAQVVAMTGTPAAAGASASLAVFDRDAAGNWPMKLTVQGLAPPLSSGPYELWLTKGRKLAALCGSFRAESDGSTVVWINAPYKLSDFDGWVVVEEGSTTPLLSTA